MVKKLRQTGKKRIRKRMNAMKHLYETGDIELEEIKRSLASTNGHLMHGDTWKLKVKLYKEFVLRR